MNTRDEILAELRAHTPFREIRKKVHSISKLYEAAGQYLDELQEGLQSKRAEVAKLKEEKSIHETQIEELRVDAESCKEQNRQLEQANVRLRNEISDETACLNDLQAEISRLQDKGFTPEIMQTIGRLLERGGSKLLEQLENVEKYQRAMKAFTALQRNMTRLRKEVNVLERRKKQIDDHRVHVENRIDELKLQARSVRDAVGTVVWLLKRGYTMEDIKALGYGLEILALDHDPDGSISRLVAALKRTKDQISVEQKLVRQRQELASLRREAEDTKTKAAIAEEVTLKSIDDTRNTSIRAIQNMEEQASRTLTAICQKFDGHVKATIENLGVQVKLKTEWMEEQCRQSSDLEHQKGAFEGALRDGRFLQSIFESDEFLSTVSVQWILALSQRICLWIRTRLPDETVFPSDSVCQRQFGLNRWQPYNASILAELMVAALEAAQLRACKQIHANRGEMS